ncbi:high affinity copper uptake protein 1 isoform X2 [Agrilus planipennis]|uniref:Copper transport protein n=1 Tax=Agrilus planipennis TaxID=224129 RepID=A0A1W4WS28_AGRPL|nr:high affinity copper uptake protein 1 isoform X2 [Agrilus planipennis]
MDHSHHHMDDGMVDTRLDHDHNHNDNGSSDSSHVHSMQMQMWFYFGNSATVLFESWTFSSIGGLVGSMIGIFFLAALYEGLKYYREYLFWKTYNALQYRAVTLPSEKGVVNDENQVVQPTILSKMHFFQTFLHVIQITLSYFLMLIFMTYNAWLCIALVLGAAFGYFLFGWKKSVIIDVTEHCH